MYKLLIISLFFLVLFLTRHMDTPINKSGSDDYLSTVQEIGDYQSNCYHYIIPYGIDKQYKIPEVVVCK
jgi:hypothetical protein